MTDRDTFGQLVDLVQSELAARADPSKAGPMAAYMKTDQPFYGVQSKGQKEVIRMVRDTFPLAANDEYRNQILALWELPHREEQHVAIGLAIANKTFISYENLDLYRRLIQEGAWWDFVDAVAIKLVGEVRVSDPDRLHPILYDWIEDDDMWVRRTAIICQVGINRLTDEDMLFEFCAARAWEKEFFIRKAIGWALRDHSKRHSDSVRSFLAEHGDDLSGLSRREASKYV